MGFGDLGKNLALLLGEELRNEDLSSAVYCTLPLICPPQLTSGRTTPNVSRAARLSS